MKIDEIYYGIKNVFGDLVGKGFYPTENAAMIDKDRLVDHAQRQFKVAEISGDSALIDQWNAEYQRARSLQIIKVCIVELKAPPMQDPEAIDTANAITTLTTEPTPEVQEFYKKISGTDK